MNYRILLAGLALICACAAQPAVPLACNTKAFTAPERTEWRRRLEQVMRSVTDKADLPDGYSFTIETGRASVVDIARWIELERKCCPFFVFEIGMRGENGSVWLNLRGGKGVKEFIKADFHDLF